VAENWGTVIQSTEAGAKKSLVRKGGLEPPWVSPPDPKSDPCIFSSHSFPFGYKHLEIAAWWFREVL